MKISMFHDVSDPSLNVALPHIEGILSGLVQITTFDVANISNHKLKSFATRAFLPSIRDTIIHASENEILLATRGYRHTAKLNGSWQEQTYIRSFSLSIDGSRAKGHTTGIVDGYLNNQYAIDIWDGHLRVASSGDSRWKCTSEKEPRYLRSTKAIGSQSFCELIPDRSNYITVLKLPTNGESKGMERVGFLSDLAEEGGHIETVWFMNEKAFIGTSKTNSFYRVDMINHFEPKVIGKLEVTGLSNYLYPYDNASNVLVAVGQDANREGDVLKLQISLFDTAESDTPTLLNRFNVEEFYNQWSTSDIQYDLEAIRFFPESKIIILPVSITTPMEPNDSFDGFFVFDVSQEKISFSFNISHVNPSELETFCWDDAYLSAKSWIHDGVLTTIKGHTIIAYDIESKVKRWELNLDENNTDCSWGGYWQDRINWMAG